MNNKLGIFVLMLAVSIFPSRFYAGVDAGSTGSRRDYDENFNSGVGEWKLGLGFEIRNHEGVTGSPALFASSPKAAKSSASMPVKVTPGVYNVSISYRTENITPIQIGQRMSFILGYLQPYDKDGKKLKAQNFWVKNHFTGGWQQFKGSVTVPQECVSAELIMVFDWWHYGSIWFDDITVETSNNRAVLFTVLPSNLRLDDKGSVAFRTVFHGQNLAESDMALQLQINGGREIILRPVNGVFQGELGSVPASIKLTARLLNLKDKSTISEQEVTFFSPETRTAPAGTTYIDEHGRTICDGKPILPIGIFTYQFMEEADLRRVSEAGFDFIAFGCRARNLNGINSNSSAEMRVMLDGLVRFNLKAMLQLTLMIPAKEHLRIKFEPDFDGFSQREKLLSALVNAVSQHPALLCYYLADENQRGELGEVRQVRENVNSIDPWHFSVAITDRPDNFPFFAPCADVLCHDKYPLPGDLSDTDANLERLSALKCHQWFCSQAYIEKQNYPSDASSRPVPSPGALRALPLLAVIHGAKGFMFYSYHEMFAKGLKIDPRLPDELWPGVASAAGMLRELEPFILSPSVPVKPDMKISSGKFRASIMRASCGRVAIPIVAITNEKGSVRVVPPSGKKYYSKYQLSTEQPDGSWIFSPNAVDCDILYSK